MIASIRPPTPVAFRYDVAPLKPDSLDFPAGDPEEHRDLLPLLLSGAAPLFGLRLTLPIGPELGPPLPDFRRSADASLPFAITAG